jgi:hypothetical protein
VASAALRGLQGIDEATVQLLADRFNIPDPEELRRRILINAGARTLAGPRGTLQRERVELGLERPGARNIERQLIDEANNLNQQRQVANQALIDGLSDQISQVDTVLKQNTAIFLEQINAAISESDGFASLGKVAENLGTIPEEIKITFTAPVEVNVGGSVDLTPAIQDFVQGSIDNALDRPLRGRGDTP